MSYGRYDSYNDSGDNRDYSSSPNPFSDSNAAGYGQTGYGSPGAHEMSTYGQTTQANTNPILVECSEILDEIRDTEINRGRLTGLQKRCLDDPDTSGESQSKRDVDLLTQEIMDQYRRLADRIRVIRSNPNSRQQATQVGLVERRLKEAVQKFQEQESVFRNGSKTQMARQIRIVRPDLSEDEVQDALQDDENGQVFQQALMHNNRMGQANQVLGAVTKRHQEMLVIEKKLEELMNLLEHMNELLVKQEVVVMEISENTHTANDEVTKANVHLDGAITSARKARKWKWWCLGICVAIVIVIVVIVVVYIMVNRAANGGGSSGSSGGGNNDNNSNNQNNNGDGSGNSDNNSPNNNSPNNSPNNNNQNSNGGGTGDGTGDSTGTGQKRSLFQRSVWDDLQMNTARAVEVAIEEPMARATAPSTHITRRRLNRVRDVAVAPEDVVKALLEKKFIVDWDGANPTGSD